MKRSSLIFAIFNSQTFSSTNLYIEMNVRPAGYSSDEDEFENFSFHGETKTEKERRCQIDAEIYQERIKLENTASHRVYNAILKHNLDEILNEINNGFDINSDIFEGWTALFLSVQQGDVIMVEELLKNGANIHQTRDDSTLLMTICSYPKSTISSDIVVKVVNILIKYEIDVKAVDRKRRNAFMFACSEGFVEVVKILLPLSDLETKDNQGWTGLFFAINKNEYDVVKLLLDAGASIEHIDVRNNDVKYYALVNDNEAILSLLPKNDFEISPEDFVNKTYDYELVFESLLQGENYDFKSDISSLLYGMKCQHFIPKFNKNNVDLVTFLTLTEEKLKELNVDLSFERNRIIQGLHNFHLRSWKKSSIPFVSPKEMFTTYDIFVTVANSAKHLIVIEGTIKYLSEHINLSGPVFDQQLVSSKLTAIKKKLDRLKLTIIKIHKKAELIDSSYPGPADLITSTSKFNRNTLNKVAFGFALIVIFGLIKTKF